MAKFYTGRDGSLLLDGVTQAKVTSWSFSSDLETLETTTLGESHRSYTPGVQGASGSATLLYYRADDGRNDAGALLKKLINTNTAGITNADTVVFTLRYAHGDINNDIKFTAYVTAASFGSNVGEVASAQINFQVTGALTEASL